MVRAHGDHYYISANVRIKKLPLVQQNFKTRNMKNFTQEIYRQGLADINWDELYNCKNIDLANSFFVDKVNAVLDSIAPVMNVQPSSKHKSWVREAS